MICPQKKQLSVGAKGIEESESDDSVDCGVELSVIYIHFCEIKVNIVRSCKILNILLAKKHASFIFLIVQLKFSVTMPCEGFICITGIQVCHTLLSEIL